MFLLIPSHGAVWKKTIKGQDKDFCLLQWNLVCSFQGNREQHPLAGAQLVPHCAPLSTALSSSQGAPKWGWTEKPPVLGPAQVTCLLQLGWESVCASCDSPCLCFVLIAPQHPASGESSPTWAHQVDLGVPWAAAASECLLRSMEKVCCLSSQ